MAPGAVRIIRIIKILPACGAPASSVVGVPAAQGFGMFLFFFTAASRENFFSSRIHYYLLQKCNGWD
jgi:hypothetical protein